MAYKITTLFPIRPSEVASHILGGYIGRFPESCGEPVFRNVMIGGESGCIVSQREFCPFSGVAYFSVVGRNARVEEGLQLYDAPATEFEVKRYSLRRRGFKNAVREVERSLHFI